MRFSSRRTAQHGLAALLLIFGFLLTVSVAGAREVQSSPSAAIDVFCITGSVINHAEQPSADWSITGVMYDPATGQTDPATEKTVDTVNDANSPDGALGSFKFDGLKPGRWNFSIGTKTGWSPITPASFDVTLNYGSRNCAVIRFKMRQDVEVTVTKIDANHKPQAGFIIHAKPGAGNYFASPVDITTDDNGVALFTLTPGLWEFSEDSPVGVSASPISPATGKQSLDVTAPGPHAIRFKNRILDNSKGCIEVRKWDVPPAGTGQPTGLPGWAIYVLRADGTTAAEGNTDATGRIVFNGLPFGPYTVSEEVALYSGWEAAAPVNYEVTLSDIACVQIEFSNRQVPPAYCIVGRKVDTNGLVGLPGWEITAKPTKDTNYTPAAVTTDGLGNFRIDFPANDYRVPEAEYNVCETMADGWLAHTATCQKVRLPKDAGACVVLGFQFENQQVGHAESTAGASSGCTAASSTYTVKANDQLYRIGSSYGKTPAQMRAANPSIRNPNIIHVGQKICIP